ncbi:hypothetical protein [Roseivirga echinicomitans]|uniref:Uncharacterized protein n=1 Tax=Roseivirga echinicomitans TaxID=296218 RepID=A0A150XUP3_9BACT|nr:hypothetical protein [Roseivirga echinicomitans]KYG82467.1 hypothetical protein AWN68_14530 [Roseivirga echinicomitans]
MKKIEHHIAGFYESIAHLFYGVAVVDNHVRTEEKEVIKELVDKDWTFAADDLDSAETIFAILKKLFAEQYDKEEAFLNFKKFFTEHRELFTEELKKKIMQGANKIVGAFAGINKSESVLISRLYFLMWK